MKRTLIDTGACSNSIDARVDTEPGKIIIETFAPQEIGEIKDTHVLTVQSLDAYAKMLFEAAPNAVLIGVGAASLSFSEELSEVVKSVVPEVVKIVKEQLED